MTFSWFPSPSCTAVTVTDLGALQLLELKLSAPDTVAAPVSLEAGVTVTAPPGSLASST